MAENINGDTAFSWAVKYKVKDVVLVFFEKEAILDAKDILNAYILAQSDNILEHMKLLQKAFDNTLMIYRRVWNTGIDTAVEGVILDDDILVLLTAEACDDNGANALLDEKFQAIIDELKLLNKNDYESTIECYVILAEYKNLIQATSSSLNDLNEAKTRLNSEFQRAMSLALLE